MNYENLYPLKRNETQLNVTKTFPVQQPPPTKKSSLQRTYLSTKKLWGTAVAQRLRYCATIRKVVVSIPAGVSGFFIDIKSFRSHYGPGVDSTPNRNEYEEYFLRVKAAGATG